MADTEKSEQPQTNGLENGLDEDERMKLRPADIDADVKEMERRKRVEMIMNSKLFREELERIIELQMKDGNGPAGLLQQISDMMGIQSGKLHTTHMFRGSNCVTPINDIRGVESMGYEKGEKNLRCKLASVFRLMDLYGWSQGINNQITARLNQDEEHFLVNPHGMLYNEITASSLVKVDMQGNIVEPGTTNFSVNTQGFLLHSAIHASRPDVNCVIHIKTPSVLAVSSLKCGLLPLCQEALVIGEVSQHPFLCGIFEPEEREKIIRNLGPSNKILLLHNHGAICCGATVEEAFYNVYNTVMACETQVKLMPIGIDNLVLINDETRKQVYDAAHRAPETLGSADKKQKQFRVGEMEFEALIRMLDNAGFRTGYIYRHPLVKGELPKPKNDVEVPPAVSSLGYLIEQEELYKQGNWKKYVDGRNRLDRTKWLNSPNVYQKVEILETGTSDPKKITKWVAESSPTHSSTPVKIDSALQFVPKGTNPKEFKKLQQQIKENRRADKITSGPQSHILEGVSWEEAKKLQDANITQTGDQVILVGAASKGIIQRNYQHNALVYKTPYAKNPFDSMSDKEIEDYKQLVERKQRGDTDYEESQSESEAISSSRQDVLRHLKSPLLSPQSATSETEEESRDEPRVLRIETKTAPRPIQAEVVLSDAESDSTDARVERSHSARYPKAEKPESVTLMNSFRKSWSLKREKDKSKDVESPEAYDSRNLHPSFILTDCEQDRMESLYCCVARIKQLTQKPVIVDLPIRPSLKSACDPCNVSGLHEEDVTESSEICLPDISEDRNVSSPRTNFVTNSELQKRLNTRKKLIHSAKMKFLGFQNGTAKKEPLIKEKASTSPMCALISEIRETINEIMSPERSKKSEESVENYFSSMRWIERPKFVPRLTESEPNLLKSKKEEPKARTSLRSFSDHQNVNVNVGNVHLESLGDFEKDFQILPASSFTNGESADCTCLVHNRNDLEKNEKVDQLKFKPKIDENQNEELMTEVLKMADASDGEATYTITDDSLLQTYSFTETTETEWYYNKTIMKLENSQTVLEIKELEVRNNAETPVIKNDTGIDTDFTSEKENEVDVNKTENRKESERMETTEDVDADAPNCETSGLNKSSETDSSFLKSSSGQTTNDIDTSYAFKTETENSDKTNEKVQSPVSKEENGETSKGVEESLQNGEENRSENAETFKPKSDNGLSKLPGIPESPEYTNIDTEDAPITSSSKDTSPEVVDSSGHRKENVSMETTKEPEVELEKEKEYAKPEPKQKKSVKSSTKITVKKEMKEKNGDEPVVSEIKLTIKNSNPCQLEKYKVKIQDVTNSSEELSRSLSSVDDNAENYESFEIVDGDCDCDARQNLEELQEEVSSTIEKLQTIENYFEDEIKKHSNDGSETSEQSKKDELIIEYNYREFEDVLNESKVEQMEVLRFSDFAEQPQPLSAEKNITNMDAFPVGEVVYAEPQHYYPEIQKTEDNFEYFVSSLLDNICGEVEIGQMSRDDSLVDFNPESASFNKIPGFSEESIEEKHDKTTGNVTATAEKPITTGEGCIGENKSCIPETTAGSCLGEDDTECPKISDVVNANKQNEKDRQETVEISEPQTAQNSEPDTSSVPEIPAGLISEKNKINEPTSLQTENNLKEDSSLGVEMVEDGTELKIEDPEDQEMKTHEITQFDEKVKYATILEETVGLDKKVECEGFVDGKRQTEMGARTAEVKEENGCEDEKVEEVSEPVDGLKPEVSEERKDDGLVDDTSKSQNVYLETQKVESFNEEKDSDQIKSEQLSLVSRDIVGLEERQNYRRSDEGKEENLDPKELAEVAEEDTELKKASVLEEEMKPDRTTEETTNENWIQSTEIKQEVVEVEPNIAESSPNEADDNLPDDSVDREPDKLKTYIEELILRTIADMDLSSFDKKMENELKDMQLCSDSREITSSSQTDLKEDEHSAEIVGDDLSSKENAEKGSVESSQKGGKNSKIFQLLKFFQNRLSSNKAITWKEAADSSQRPKLENSRNEAVSDIVNCLLNSVTSDKRKSEPSVNDVINFFLKKEESPADSLAEFEDLENIITNSASIVADIIDSVESQLEGDVESLPDEEEMKEDPPVSEKKTKKSDSMFKVMIATPTKREIFINYSASSSSTFDISSDQDLCNSYIKTDDIDDNFEDLSSDNPDFFSADSSVKNSLNNSFDSVSSAMDGRTSISENFCCLDCENNLMKKSPRSLAIIQEVDESDNSTSSGITASEK